MAKKRRKWVKHKYRASSGRPESIRPAPICEIPPPQVAPPRKIAHAMRLFWSSPKFLAYRYCGVFALLTLVFYLVLYSSFFGGAVLSSLVDAYSSLTNLVLHLIGTDSTQSGTLVFSDKFSMRIVHECTAVEPCGILAAAVLAYPAPFRARITGVVMGLVLLQVINLVRLVSLFLIGEHFSSAFEFVHGDGWQILFLILAIGMWLLWLQWIGRPGMLRTSE
jgi:exosortase/archaeosortase family protein